MIYYNNTEQAALNMFTVGFPAISLDLFAFGAASTVIVAMSLIKFMQ